MRAITEKQLMFPQTKATFETRARDRTVNHMPLCGVNMVETEQCKPQPHASLWSHHGPATCLSVESSCSSHMPLCGVMFQPHASLWSHLGPATCLSVKSSWSSHMPLCGVIMFQPHASLWSHGPRSTGCRGSCYSTEQLFMYL
ncbi:hypothetical protein BsWGS_26475 [Bradybaena similaris]